MDFEKYEHHLWLLSAREDNAKTRFRMFRFDMRAISSMLCGYADVLQYGMQQAQFFPTALVDFQIHMKSLCATLQELDEKTQCLWENLNDQRAQANLWLYWDRRVVVQEMFSLADQSTTVENEIDYVVGQSTSLPKTLEHRANLLWAMYDVLLNPGAMDIPDELVQLEKSVREAQKKTEVGNSAGLEVLINASRSESRYFRDIAAVTLEHFKDESAVDALISLLFDDAEHIRGNAAKSLGYIKDTRAVPSLIQALQQNFVFPHSVGMIADALAAMPDERAVDALVAVLEKHMKARHGLDDRHAYPLAGIYNALRRIGGEKADAAIKHYFGS